MNLTYTIDQVLCPKVQSKHGDRYHVLGTRQLLNRDRYNVLFGMLVSNRYSFVKQISVWNQTEKKKLQGTIFTLFFLYKSARYSLFRQKYLYTYTLNQALRFCGFCCSGTQHQNWALCKPSFEPKSINSQTK